MIRGLDLCCGAGGATEGYYRGFEDLGVALEMTGVDIRKQPRYEGDYFIRANMLDLLKNIDFIKSFDFVHASPPCQCFSLTKTFGKASQDRHPDLLTPMLSIVKRNYPDMIWITENVPEAPMYSRVHQILKLCASSFPGHCAFDERRLLHRHRNFRLHNFRVPNLRCAHNGYKPKGVYGSLNSDVPGGGEVAVNLAEAQKLMQIDWMKWHELKEAIPPAYTEYISEGGLVKAVLDRA